MSTMLYITHLSTDDTLVSVATRFAQFGELRHVQLLKDRQGQPAASVRFSTHEAAREAYEAFYESSEPRVHLPPATDAQTRDGSPSRRESSDEHREERRGHGRRYREEDTHSPSRQPRRRDRGSDTPERRHHPRDGRQAGGYRHGGRDTSGHHRTSDRRRFDDRDHPRRGGPSGRNNSGQRGRWSHGPDGYGPEEHSPPRR